MSSINKVEVKKWMESMFSEFGEDDMSYIEGAFEHFNLNYDDPEIAEAVEDIANEVCLGDIS